MSLTIVECRNCGSSYWVNIEGLSGAIAGGPCCKGIEVLNIERYATERLASKAYPSWAAADLAAMQRKRIQAEAQQSKPEVLRYAA